MNNKNIGIIVCIIACYFILLRTRIENIENIADMNAAEACKRISSRAEEIEKHYKGAAEIVQKATTFLNPNNYRSGDNTSDDIMRNIINTNFSSEDISKIEADCTNTFAGIQINEIDATKCPYCWTNGCDITNVTQTNISKSIQTCQMQSAIDILMSKKNSIDAQALAQTLQQAQDVLSGNNKSKKENCNIVRTDMTSENYMDIRAKCSNNHSLEQGNKIAACGSVMNVIQKNISEKVNACIMSQTVIDEEEISSDKKLKTEMTSEQKTTGVSMWASLGSSLSVVLSLSVIGITLYFVAESEAAKEAVKKM